MPPINLPSGIQLIVLPTSHIFLRISLYYTSLPYSNTELIKVKSIFVMWQQIITSLIYFLAVGVHVTDASCDETHMIFSQNHDKGISPNCKILKNIVFS